MHHSPTAPNRPPDVQRVEGALAALRTQRSAHAQDGTVPKELNEAIADFERQLANVSARSPATPARRASEVRLVQLGLTQGRHAGSSEDTPDA